MRAAYYTRTGAAADVLELADLAEPVAGTGEVLVRVRASGINPADVKRRAGWRGVAMAHPRIIPHCDGAGEIVDIGPGVENRKTGDRVWTQAVNAGSNLWCSWTARSSRSILGTNRRCTLVDVNRVFIYPRLNPSSDLPIVNERQKERV